MNRVDRHDIGKLIIRVSLGGLILLHGIHKLLNGVGGIEGMLNNAGLPAVFALGAYVGEVIAPILLIVGFYGRVAALVIAINMVAAIALAHSQELFQLTPQGGWALELQGMYLFTAIGLAFTGVGRIAFNSRFNQ